MIPRPCVYSLLIIGLSPLSTYADGGSAAAVEAKETAPINFSALLLTPSAIPLDVILPGLSLKDSDDQIHLPPSRIREENFIPSGLGESVETTGPEASNKTDVRRIEESLVRKAQSGDASAFETLYQQNAPKLRNSILWMTDRNEEMTDDILQEVFLSFFKNIKSFDCKSSLYTYLYRIGINEVLESRRYSRHKPDPQIFASIDDDSDETKIPLTEKLLSRDLRLEGTTDRLDILKAVESIPEPYRRAFKLFYFDELSAKEIVSIYNHESKKANTDAVKQRIQKARMELIKRLGPSVAGNSSGNETASFYQLLASRLDPETLESAVQKLTPKARSIFILSKRFTNAEISEMTELSSQAIKGSLSQAHQQLLRLLPPAHR